MWKEEFDKKYFDWWEDDSLDFTAFRPIVLEFISSLLEKQKQEFINGYRCLGCGKKTDTALADWCGSCLED